MDSGFLTTSPTISDVGVNTATVSTPIFLYDDMAAVERYDNDNIFVVCINEMAVLCSYDAEKDEYKPREYNTTEICRIDLVGTVTKIEVSDAMQKFLRLPSPNMFDGLIAKPDEKYLCSMDNMAVICKKNVGGGYEPVAYSVKNPAKVDAAGLFVVPDTL
jgi:hypothetical protein